MSACRINDRWTVHAAAAGTEGPSANRTRGPSSRRGPSS